MLDYIHSIALMRYIQLIPVSPPFCAAPTSRVTMKGENRKEDTCHLLVQNMHADSSHRPSALLEHTRNFHDVICLLILKVEICL
jgi:hypothetical protein